MFVKNIVLVLLIKRLLILQAFNYLIAIAAISRERPNKFKAFFDRIVSIKADSIHKNKVSNKTGPPENRPPAD